MLINFVKRKLYIFLLKLSKRRPTPMARVFFNFHYPFKSPLQFCVDCSYCTEGSQQFLNSGPRSVFEGSIEEVLTKKHALHWIVIYPVDSVIHLLNNTGPVFCKR